MMYSRPRETEILQVVREGAGARALTIVCVASTMYSTHSHIVTGLQRIPTVSTAVPAMSHLVHVPPMSDLLGDQIRF